MNDKLITRTAPVIPSSYDEKSRSVRMTIATENPVVVFDYERWEFVREILLMEGMVAPENGQVPLVDTHDRWTIESMLGSVRDFKIVDGCCEGTAFFASDEDSQAAEMKVREGHLTDTSCGYSVAESSWIPQGQSIEIKGKRYEGPLKVTRRWGLREVSLTIVGADEYSKVMRSGRLPPEVRAALVKRGLRADSSDEEAAQFLNKELEKTTIPTTSAQRGTEMDPKEPEAPKGLTPDEARKLERERVSEINAIAEQHGERVKNIAELQKKAIDGEWSAERFSKEVLNNLAPSAPIATVDAPPAGRAEVKVRELVKPWQKRSVLAMHALVAQARGSYEKAAVFQGRLNEANRQMTPELLEAERQEAIGIIMDSKLPIPQQMRLLSTLSSGAGAAILPAPFLAEVFVIVEERGLARRLFRVVPMGSKTLDLKNIATKPGVYWVDEGSNGTASDLAFGTGQLAAKKLMAITSWSSELEEDEAIAHIPIVQELFAEGFLDAEDDAGFAGDGTSNFGSFTGLLNAATAIETMDAGKTSFADVSADDLRATRDNLTLAKRRGAVWMLHPDIISVVEGLKDLQGRYIYRGPGEARPATLWGYPIANDGNGIESMPALSADAVSTRFVAFGNPKYMLMGMRREIDLQISREGILNTAADAISFNAFQADGALLKMTERVAFACAVASAFSVLRTAAA